MKKWENPEVTNLEISETEETKCYCQNGIDEEVITYHGGKPHRPGHGHKPDRPGKPCPPDPEPNPTPDEIDPDFGVEHPIS